jgi:hypothetical protein
MHACLKKIPYPEHIKNVYNLTINTQKTQVKKWANNPDGHFSKEDVQMPTSMWKDARHH